MGESILVSNVQKFCLHDGPGIRTTVFLMGCSLRCPWCANPENLSMQKKIEFDQSKCIARNGKCFLWEECPMNKGVNPLPQEGIAKCVTGALHVRGENYDAQTLTKELLRDEYYFHHGGGVTFSGGEPLLQASALIPVLKALNERQINICFETSLCVPQKNVKDILPYVDQMYIDIKLADMEQLRNIVGGDFALYRENLAMVANEDIHLTVRFPIVPGITDTSDNIDSVKRLLRQLGLNKIEIFSVHNLAEGKYKSLGLDFQYFDVASSEHLHRIKEELLASIDDVSIISL